MVRRLSIIIIILSAAVLVYGFIDAGSYRTGYREGSVAISRAVDSACGNGLVLDSGLCDRAETILYSSEPKAVMGLANISDNLVADIAPTVVRSKRRVKKSKAPASSEAVVSKESAAPVQPVAPVISPETQKIIDRIKQSLALPAKFCSDHTVLDCMDGDRDRTFICSKASGACTFNSRVSTELLVDITKIDQYTACLTRDIVNTIGIAKQVMNTCVAIDGSSKAVILSNPTDARMVGEFTRSKEFSAALTASGISASTAVAPVTATISLPSCREYMMQNYVPDRPMVMDMSKCTPDPMPSGTMNMSMPSCSSSQYWNGSACVSNAYIPSTLAELISIIVSLFR